MQKFEYDSRLKADLIKIINLSQAKAKLSQAKPSQAEPNQAKPS